MDAFKKALDVVIDSMIKLEAEWERIEETHSDHLAEHYPLHHDFREVVLQIMEWRETINNHLEE
ncbi:hypothetical protein GE107_01565 [Cohnella sp. CFH 77786]|uniref:hypothetical protein n=1 Tax=Cohnella sp. CFH 77786 TaxID=2662265 RepID=UPI001C60F1B6|nr:hypothetical protein [Cohnella sp. CFH 77786]MBW5444753.1 hypothetical protein [Cohnella sp. CFH 77786]